MIARTADQTAGMTAGQMPRLLSVVMPNYNHAEFISQALAAVLGQSRKPDEIVIVDDCSTDRSRSIIERAAAEEPRIRTIFNSANIGAIASINRGLKAARGEFVCLMAADDVASPEFFSLALKALEQHREVALFCAEMNIRHVGAPPRKAQIRPIIRPSHRPRAFPPEETKTLLRYNDNFIVPLATVFRRDRLLEEGGLDPQLGSMADGFVARRLALKYGFCFAPHVVVTWQVRRESLSRATARAPDAVLALLREARTRISGDPVFPRGYAAVFERRLRFATCRLALLDGHPDWKFLKAIGSSTWMDRRTFACARMLPRQLAVFSALAWLTLRLRPYSLLAIAGTLFRRKLTRQPARSRGDT